MIFPFLRWTIVPTARLPPALVAQSSCLHSINSQLLPVKFNCPTPTPSVPPVSPKKPDSVICISQKLLQISSFCQLSLELLALFVGRERVGIFTGSHGKNWKLTFCICNVQQSALLMILNQDYFSWWARDFFLLENGKCELFSIPVAIYEAKKAGSSGTFHPAGALN